jgi:beta-phosphoglucomutase-like phosphatase (HAD superfamily)
LSRKGIHAFTGSLQYLDAAREAGVKSAVLSASVNTDGILERSGLAPLIDRIIDGNLMRIRDLEGKPAPDTIVAACELLGIRTAEAATFETTVDGLDAGRSAGVGIAVAVDRTGRAQTLRAHGAQLVVPDLAGLLDLRA